MTFYIRLVFTSAIFLFLSTYSITGQVRFEKTTSFYPNSERLQHENVTWGYLTVPENWKDLSGRQISLATAILGNTSGKSDANAIIYIPGGPGGDGISSIWFWLNHSLRVENDIVLVDIRGTGFSEPRLCPDLGNDFLNILAKNQSPVEDEKQRIAAAISCVNQLSIAGVDAADYNSKSVAQDLNALKTNLGYLNWHVYGVSYGTFMAQVYTSLYPKDVKSLLLDSAISDVTKYYTKNTSGYINSLRKVFEICKNDPLCNSKYPKLEKIYYQTIKNLGDKPIAVEVDLEILNSSNFTYNQEDFKVALQQALYDKKLIQLVPLLIYEFHNRNTAVLSSLVAAFSGALGMDYGVYYSINCNEVLPYNSLSDYEKDAVQYAELNGGLSFYKSDFSICKVWNESISDNLNGVPDLSNLSKLDIPILIFSGGFDPITPPQNGKKMLDIFNDGYLINASNYGHGPGFSEIGSEIAAKFINNPNLKPSEKEFVNEGHTTFVKNIKLNSGVAKLANSLNQPNFVFLGPLIIALGIICIFTFVYLLNFLRKKYNSLSDKVVRVLIIFTSFFGIGSLIGLILAINQVAQQNFYMLVFGLPESYNYLFIGILLFLVLLSFTLLYLALGFRKIKNRSVVFSAVFSNILLAAYFFYWQILWQ